MDEEGDHRLVLHRFSADLRHFSAEGVVIVKPVSADLEPDLDPACDRVLGKRGIDVDR